MASRIIREYLEGQRARARWLEFDAYARRVFANSASDWLTQSTRYANTMIQAQKAVRTEVMTIDLADPMLERGAMRNAQSALTAAQAVFMDATARSFVMECVDAITHKLGNEVDLFLRFPAPRDLLLMADNAEPDFDALDELSMGIIAALREFSNKPIAGLCMVRSSEAGVTRDEEDAYSPIFNAAHHYGWVSALAMHASLCQSPATIDGVDLVLGIDLPLDDCRKYRCNARNLAGGLTNPWWLEDGVAMTAADGDLLYGTIPDTANPEIVLKKCAAVAG